MLIDYLFIFFKEMSIQIICLFLKTGLGFLLSCRINGEKFITSTHSISQQSNNIITCPAISRKFHCILEKMRVKKRQITLCYYEIVWLCGTPKGVLGTPRDPQVILSESLVKIFMIDLNFQKSIIRAKWNAKRVKKQYENSTKFL